MDDRQRIDHLFNQSLFEALARRRTRRFGLGYKINDGITNYESKKAPVPLTELELAILCWAADGVTGLALGEQQVVTGVMSSWNGRVHPCPCNSQNSVLAFINDDGIFLYKPPAATQLVEIKTPEDRLKILDVYRKHTVRIVNERPQIPDMAWLSSNRWGVNKKGTTFFLPIIDVTAEYINFLLFAFGQEGYYIYDNIAGKPAGTQRWIDKGVFDAEFSMPLVMFENFIFNLVVSMAHYKIQNLSLACEVMGLGCWAHTGFAPFVLLGETPLCRGLGATFIRGKDGIPNPVALKNHLESYCPPNYKSMDEAVDAIVADRWGENGIFVSSYTGSTPIKKWKNKVDNVPKYSEQILQVTKDYCNYILDEYGRFPAFIDSLLIPVGATVHHVDLDFYKTYYPPDALTEHFHNHMKIWHED